MFETQTDTRAETAGRLLKARLVLRRLRPLKLETVVNELRGYLYSCQALRLMTTHFPDKAHYNIAKLPGWDDTFGDFCRSVEAAGWFELDWDNLLDPDYQVAAEGDDDGVFARWLWEIPILCVGFSDYDDSWPEMYPPMALLKGLLSDWPEGREFVWSLIEEYGLDTGKLDNLYHSDLWDRLTSGDFAGYDKPLCWLPDVARIACGSTGNVLLDSSNYLDEEPLGWTWTDDLDKARAAWAEAKPAILHLREFLSWCVSSDDMQAVIDALAEPKRKRRRKSKSKTLVELLAPSIER